MAVKPKFAQFVPHSAGRYQTKRFRKAQCPIVERLVCSLMMHGRNNGKKLIAVRIVRHAFDIINLLTDSNPVQVRGENFERECFFRKCLRLRGMLRSWELAGIFSFLWLTEPPSFTKSSSLFPPDPG